MSGKTLQIQARSSYPHHHRGAQEEPTTPKSCRGYPLRPAEREFVARSCSPMSAAFRSRFTLRPNAGAGGIPRAASGRRQSQVPRTLRNMTALQILRATPRGRDRTAGGSHDTLSVSWASPSPAIRFWKDLPARGSAERLSGFRRARRTRTTTEAHKKNPRHPNRVVATRSRWSVEGKVTCVIRPRAS